MVVKKDVEGDGSDGWGWMEGGERGCRRASWVDLGFGCRKMGGEGKGRLMLDGWGFYGVRVPGGRLSEFLCLVVRECRRKGLCSWIDFFFWLEKTGFLEWWGIGVEVCCRIW